MTDTEAVVLERAENALASSPHVADKQVRLSVEGDCVRVDGVVSSYFQKQMVQETLRHVVEPLRIDNELQVD